jgi:protein SCO1/2
VSFFCDTSPERKRGVLVKTRRLRSGLVFVALICLTCFASCQRSPIAETRENIDYPVGDFALTERSGREVRTSDLGGNVWIASFIFTRCSGPCPQVTATMAELQSELASQPDVRLVTFTVDPEYDDPKILTQYAERFHADPDRWLFLTGKESDVYRLLRDGFKIGASKNTDAGATPGEAVNHDTHLAVVDRRGHVRGYFSAFRDPESDNPEKDFQQNQERLRAKVLELLACFYPPLNDAAAFYPPFNASLNAAAGVFLLLGYAAIRRRWIRLHIACMLSALAVSAVFLAFYLYFHIVVMHLQPTRFSCKWPDAPQWVEIVYRVILTSHTILAVVTAPLALYTASLGLRGRLVRHVWIARWTLPIWLYVSVTGVVVYWMLYRLY